MQVVFAKSVQGASHIRRENENLSIGRKFPCQDKSIAEKNLVAADGTKFNFLAVCDGHGGAPYFRSEKGADFAIQVEKDILIRNMKRIKELADSKDYEAIKNQLSIAIPKRWREKVETDLSNNPITEQEYAYLGEEKPDAVENYKAGNDLYSIYGCTSVIYFSTETFWYALQIGDGDFAISFDGESFEMPMPEDKDCFLNQTTSLCDHNAQNEFRYIAGETKPKCVFCSTDGIANSFKDKQSLISNFYSPVSRLFSDEDQFQKCHNCRNSVCDVNCRFEICKSEIENYLPQLSKKGSGDDISLVLCIDIDESKTQAILSYLRGTKLYSNGQKSKGINLLKTSAVLNNSKAQERLGDIYVDASKKCDNQSEVFRAKAKEYYTAAYNNADYKEDIKVKLDNIDPSSYGEFITKESE